MLGTMSHVTLETPFTIPEGVVSREIEGETVLLNLESGRYFGLNAVGTRVWQFEPGRIVDFKGTYEEYVGAVA